MNSDNSISNKLFQTTCNLALKVIDALEYIHSTGFVHNDIKAQNILLGHGKLKENEVYLVDFGLATSYQKHGIHLVSHSQHLK
jgi:serine/threonine protein kinase